MVYTRDIMDQLLIDLRYKQIVTICNCLRNVKAMTLCDCVDSIFVLILPDSQIFS